MGYLTGSITPRTAFDPTYDLRAMFPRFTVEARRANWRVVGLLQRVGQRRYATPAQVALAWLLARHPWIVPIPGTTQVRHFEQNLDWLNVELTAEDIRELDSGIAEFGVEGARAPEALLARHDIGANLGTSSKGGDGMSPLPATQRD